MKKRKPLWKNYRSIEKLEKSKVENSPIINIIGHYWRFSEETKKLDPVFMRFGFRANFKKNIR